MKRSFTASFPRCDCDIGADGMAAVFNTSADPSVSINVCEVRTFARPINPDQTNILGNQGKVAIQRITAASGTRLVSPVKYDTASSDLPSGVKLYSNPDSVTLGSQIIRKFGDCLASYTITKATISLPTTRAPGILDTNDHSGRSAEAMDLWHADGLSDTETLILREGQGIALVRKEFGIPQAMHIGLTIRVLGTGKTYRYSDGDFGSVLEKDNSTFALMNESGSGVTLQVMIISLPTLGEENIPMYRIVKCQAGFDGRYPGEEVTPAAHDTAASLVGIKAYRGPMRVLSIAASQGAQVDYYDYQTAVAPTATQQRAGTLRRWLGAGPYIRETETVTLCPEALTRGEPEVWPGDRRGVGAGLDMPIILRPGEGLAVIGGGAGLIETSEQAYLDIEIAGYINEPYNADEIAEAVWTRTGRTLT